MNIHTPIILRKFKMNYIKDNSFILIIGMVGKSTITKDILYDHSDIPIGIVICDKKKSYDYIPSIFVHNEYIPKNVRRFIKNQIFNVQNSDIDARSFCIMDMQSYAHVKKNKYFQRLCEHNHKLKTLFIIEMFFLESLNNKNIEIQKKVDYIFILKENVVMNRDFIYDQYEDYLGIEFSLFCKLIDDYTSDYNCLVLDVRSKSRNIQDKLYWYKANIHNQDFKMCCDESWNYNKQNGINDFKCDDYEHYIEKIYKRELFY
jgi:hypothetical protein